MKKIRSPWLLLALGALTLVLSFGARALADGAISPGVAAKLIKEMKSLQLIDVRTPAEYTVGHLAKAELIPLQELEGRLTEIDKAKPVLLYCRSGNRSGLALRVLYDHGYTQAQHMEGGISAWQAAGLPVTK